MSNKGRVFMLGFFIALMQIENATFPLFVHYNK